MSNKILNSNIVIASGSSFFTNQKRSFFVKETHILNIVLSLLIIISLSFFCAPAQGAFQVPVKYINNHFKRQTISSNDLMTVFCWYELTTRTKNFKGHKIFSINPDQLKRVFIGNIELENDNYPFVVDFYPATDYQSLPLTNLILGYSIMQSGHFKTFPSLSNSSLHQPKNEPPQNELSFMNDNYRGEKINIGCRLLQ